MKKRTARNKIVMMFYSNLFGGKIFDLTQSYNNAFLVAMVICLLQAGLTFITKPPRSIVINSDISIASK